MLLIVNILCYQTWYNHLHKNVNDAIHIATHSYKSFRHFSPDINLIFKKILLTLKNCTSQPYSVWASPADFLLVILCHKLFFFLHTVYEHEC